MNAPVLLAQLSGSGQPDSPPKTLKVEKPQDGQAVMVHLDGNTRIDFSDVASENLTFVRVGDKLIVLFDNHSTVTIEPVFDSSGHPLADVAFEMTPDHTLTGDQFATLFPITTDPSILPANGGGPTAGANFSAPPPVDPLSVGNPLALLGAGFNEGNLAGHTSDLAPPTHVPTAEPDIAIVVEAGISPINVPFAGTPVATGNVLTNDIAVDSGAVKVVTGVAVGAGSTPSGNLGATLTGVYGTLVMAADGSFTYTLNNAANSATNALAQGQHASDVFTYTMSDSLGDSSTTTLSIDVIGTDDRPVIAPADKTATEPTIVETVLTTGNATPHVETGVIHFSDVDLTDRPSATVGTQTATYIAADGHTVLTLSPTELAAIEQAFTVATAPGSANNGAIDWTYSIPDSALDFLSRNETVTLVSTVVVDDHNGGTDTATVTVTLKGSDDKPVIDAGVTDAVTEQAGKTLSLSPDTVPVTVHFTDPDLDNVGHTAAVIGVSASGVTTGILPGGLGTAELLSFLHIDSVTKAAGSSDGDINATFSAPDLAFDYLAAGEKLTITYTLLLNDHAGGTDTQTVSVIVTGTNDAPTFVSGPETSSLREDVNVSHAGNLHSQGALAFADVDLSDTHAVATSLTATYSGGTIPIPDSVLLSAFSTTLNDSTGSAVGSVGWNFALADSLVQSLAQGETLTLSYDVTVTDEHLASDTQTVTVTIHGTNDNPVVTNVVATGQEDTPPIAVTLTGSDVDHGDSIATFKLSSLPTDGTLYLDAAMTTAVVAGVDYAASATNALTLYFDPDHNFSGTDSVQYTATDHFGGVSNPATVTIDVAPVADVPAISGMVQIELNPADSTTAGSTQMVTLAGGGFVEVWPSATTPADGTEILYAQIINGSGQAVGSPIQIASGLLNPFTGGNPVSPDPLVVALAGGGFAVTWSTNNHLFEQTFNADGSAAGTVNQIDVTGFSPIASQLLAVGDGFAIVYEDGENNKETVHTRLFGADGTPFADQTVNTAPTPPNTDAEDSVNFPPGEFSFPTALQLVSVPDGYAVGWSSLRDNQEVVLIRVFHGTDGTPATPEIQVSTPPAGANDIGFTADGTNAGALIAAQTNGDVAVVWERQFADGSTEIMTRLFHAAENYGGGTEVQAGAVSTNSGEPNEAVQIITLANGGYAVLWSQGDSSFSNTIDSYIQVFDANGHIANSANSAGILVDDSAATGAGASLPEQVLALSDGRLVVMWGSDFGTGDVFVRVFNPDGTAVDGDGTQVNPTAAGGNTQYFGVQTIAFSDGGFAVVYDQAVGNGSPGNQDHLFVQQYDNSGNAIGAPLELSSSPFSGGLGPSEYSNFQDFRLTLSQEGVLLTGGTTGDNSAFQATDGTFAVNLTSLDTDIGTENQPIMLFTAAVTDTSTSPTTGGLEALTLTISGFPPGTIFLANGVQVGTFDSVHNTWVISDPTQIATLAADPLSVETPKGYSGNFTLSVDAQVIDSAVLSTGLVSSAPLDVIKTYDVTVTDINDVVLGNPSAISVTSGVGPVTLGIAAPIDPDQAPGEHDIIMIQAVPAYGVVQYFDGTNWQTASDGTVLTSAELTSLQYVPPADGSFHGDSIVYSVQDGASLVDGSIAITVSDAGGGLYFSGDGHTGQLNADLFTLDAHNNLTSIPVNLPNGSSAGEDGGFVQFANQLYFFADRDDVGSALFALGADNVSRPVLDGNGHPITAPGGNVHFTIYDGSLYFGADVSGHGDALVQIDPTGAVHVFDTIAVDPQSNVSTYPGEQGGFAEFEGNLYFSALDSNGVNALFDLSPGGALTELAVTEPVIIGGQYQGPLPDAGIDGGFVTFNGGLFFNAADPGLFNFDVLFTLDANGNPTPVLDAFGGELFDLGAGPANFHVFDGSLYLTAISFEFTLDPNFTEDIFKVDANGNVSVLDYQGSQFDFTAANGHLGGLVDFDGKLFFSADTDITDSALIGQGLGAAPVLFSVTSSGTATAVIDSSGHYLVNAGEDGGFVTFNGHQYFFADDATHSAVLFEMDPSPINASTVNSVTPVLDPTNTGNAFTAPDTNPPGQPSADAHFTLFDGSLYFEAQTGEGTELVQIDSSGLAHVIDVNPDAGPPPGDGFPGEDGGFGVYTPIATLFGTDGDDHLSAGANTIVIGGKGNDTISGAGAGANDTAVIDANFGDPSTHVSLNGGVVTVTTADGTDTVTGIDRIQFADKGLLIVDPTGQYGFSSVQAAVNAAAAGDIIWVLPGTYSDTTIPTGFSATAGGLFIDTPNLTLQGVEADGTAITSVTEANKDTLPLIISGAQTDFGSNIFIGPDAANTVIQGLHLQAGAETNNKLLEIWANNVTVENNFLDVNIGGTTYSGAIAVYFNDNGTAFTDTIASYTVANNILNEGIDISNGVGIPSPLPSPNQVISDNTFDGSFDIATGLGRYDTFVLNGQVPGIAWLLESTQVPTITGNQFGDNSTPFLLRGSDINAADLPNSAEVAAFLAANGNADTTYAYVEKANGDLELAMRDFGSGPFFSFAVTNTIDTLELALEPAGHNTIFSDQSNYFQAGDTVFIQSGRNALGSSIDVDGLLVEADQDSAALTLTLATALPDGTPVTVQSLSLLDYAAGQGANVNVVGNDLGDTISGNHGDNVITTGSGNDTITGGGGNDTITSGGGDDLIIYNVADGGREAVDGGSGTDTQIVSNLNGSAETFNINPIDASHLGINIEPGIDVAVPATIANSEISDTNVEEIGLHLGSDGDTVIVSGNLNGTGVLTSTITIDGGAGDDTIDANAIDPAYPVDVVFTGGGGNDDFVGGPGADTIIYNVTDGGTETVAGGAGIDTQIIDNTGGNAETFNINPIDAGHLGINIEFGAAIVPASIANSEISDTGVEEIVVRLGADGDQVIVAGDLSGTGVSSSTITIQGGDGDDTVDLSQLKSNNDVVYDGGGQADGTGDTAVLGVDQSAATIQPIFDSGGHLIGVTISYTGSDGPVTDTFTHVENFQFNDGTQTLGDLFPATVHPDAVAVADTVNKDEGTVVAQGNAITDVGDAPGMGAGVTLSITAVGGSAANVGHDLVGTYGTLHLDADGGYTYTANAALDALPSGQSASDVFDVTVGSSNGGSVATTLTFNITGADDTPVNSVPGAQTIASPVSTLVLSSANGDALSVSDADSSSLSVTLSVMHGTLTLHQETGLTSVSGDDSATVTFSGSIDAIDAALDGLTYANTPGYSGSDTLQIVSDDGSQSDTDTVGITVIGNHAPVIQSFTNGSVTDDFSSTVTTSELVTDGGFEQSNLNAWTVVKTIAASDIAARAGDPHSGGASLDLETGGQSTDFVHLSQQISNTVAGVSYTISFWVAENGTNGPSSLDVLWNGSTALALNNVPSTGSFDNYVEHSVTVIGTGQPTTLEFVVHNANAFLLDDISMTSVGITPGIETTNGTVTFTDADIGDIHTVSVAPNSNFGTFAASLGTESSGGSTGTVNWTFSATDAQISAVVGAQQTVTEIYAVTIDDGQGGDATQNVSVTIANPDHAPVVATSTNGTVIDFASGTGVETTQGTVTFTDADATDKHTISFTPDQQNHVGTFTPILVTDANGAGTVDWTYTVNDSALAFLAKGQSEQQSYSVTIDDGHGGKTIDDVMVTLIGGDHAPTPVADVVNVNEDATAAATAPGVLGNDTDPDIGDAATLVVSAVLAGTSGTASIVSGSTATVVDGIYGNLSILADGTYSYTPNTAAAEALAQGQQAQDVFTYTAKDTSGQSATTTLTFDITGQDDAPVNSVPGAQAITSPATLVLSSMNGDALSVSDIDSGSLSVTLTVMNGTLTLHQETGLTSVSGDGSSIVTFSGTINAIDAALDGLTYTANPGFAGGDTLQIVSNDGQLSDTDTVGITVTGDHAPMFTSAPETGNVVANASFNVPLGQLVSDGGFENIPLTPPWMVVDQTGDTAVTTGGGHTGDDAGFLTATTNSGDVVKLSQVLNTVAGIPYTITFWFQANAPGGSFSSLRASWDGTSELFLQNMATAGAWVEETLNVIGTGQDTLQFNMQDRVTFIFLDDVSVQANFTPGTETTRGTMTFTDADVGDIHTITVAPNSNVGTFTASLGTESSNNSTGTVNWTFSATDAQITALVGAQQSTSETYTVIINDGHGGVASQVVTVDINNPDHAPQVTSGAQTGSVTANLSLGVDTGQLIQDGGFESGNNNGLGFAWTAVLPVASTRHTVGDILQDQTFPTQAGGQTLELVNASDAANDVIKLTQAVGGTVAGVPYELTFFVSNEGSDPNNFIHVLWNSQTVLSLSGLPDTGFNGFTEYSATLIGTGTTSTLEFDFQNSQGYLIDSVSLLSLTTPGTEKTAGTITFTDADAGDVHTVSVAPIAGATGYIGALTASIGTDSVPGTPGTVNWTYSVSDAATASLGANQSLTQTYVVTINDGHGGVTAQDVTVVIHGAAVSTDTTPPMLAFASDSLRSGSADTFGGTITDNATGSIIIQLFSGNSPTGTAVSGAATNISVTAGFSANWSITADTSLGKNGHAYVQATDAAGNVAIASRTLTPAGASGSAINLALTDYSDHSGLIAATITGLAAGWALSEGTQNADGSWTVQTSDIGALSVTSPDGYVGALVLDVSESWTNANGTHGTAVVPDNVEAYAKGSPIFAWSGDDTLTASTAGNDTLVFANQIGTDVVHNFDTAHDKIDLIGFTGFASFADVQAHVGHDASGNAVITLADGETITLTGVNAASLSAGDFEFNQTPVTNNTGDMVIGDGALLPLSGIVDNTGSIHLGSAGSETDLEIVQHGVTLEGGGTVVLSDNAENVIFGSDPGVTLTNVDNVISGAGQIGDGQMTLVNEGSIIADGSNPLVIDTGAEAVINSGVLEALGSGGLTVHSDVANDGLLWANGGDITLDGDVSGMGSALISGHANLEIGGAFNEQVKFDNGASGTLTLDHSADFKGLLSGLGDHDSIDLHDILGATASLNYAENAAGTGGTLTVNDGSHTANIALSGQYATSDFVVTADSANHALVQIEQHAHQMAAAA